MRVTKRLDQGHRIKQLLTHTPPPPELHPVAGVRLVAALLRDIELKLTTRGRAEVSRNSWSGDQPEIPVPETDNEPHGEPAIYFQPVSNAHGTVLETLPPELRLQLLSGLDFKSLNALVHASPVYHTQYFQDRKSLLFNSFMDMLRGAALDAQMAFHSGTKAFVAARSKKTVDQSLNSYANYRSSSSWTLPHALSSDGNASDKFRLDDIFTLDEVTSMVTFHKSVVEPLTKHFADWALQNLVQLPEAQSCSQPLSDTEKARISRALYRYQVCCNLFGFRDGESEHPQFEAEYILQQLERLFEPWEIEELVCVTLFFERKSMALAKVIRNEIAENDGTSDGEDAPQIGNPFGTFQDSESDHIRGLLSRGLPVLKEIFFEAMDRSQLLSILRDNAVDMTEGYFLGNYGWDAFGLDTITGKILQPETERDIKEQQRAPLPFQGDQTVDSEGVYPPFAWTLMWEGTYSNRLGTCLEFDIHCWGYVFWDSMRIETMGAKEVLETQCRGLYRPYGDEDELSEGEDEEDL